MKQKEEDYINHEQEIVTLSIARDRHLSKQVLDMLVNPHAPKMKKGHMSKKRSLIPMF